jgi:hypothetical protein
VRHALPHPLRQHRFYRDGHHEIEGEKRPSLGGKQGEREDAQVVAVVGEDEAIEHEEAENDTAEENGDRQDYARPRKQQHDGGEEQERDASERAELTHIGDTCIGPADRGLER